MIAAMRESQVPMPGWTDRLAPDPGSALPAAEAIRVHTPLKDVSLFGNS